MKTIILYEDNDVIVCHKPAGFPVQSMKASVMDMESELKGYLKKSSGTPYIGIIHRLDQPVEGIIVFAKNKKAAAYLSGKVHSRIDDTDAINSCESNNTDCTVMNNNSDNMSKIYEAVIYGHMADDEGILRNYIDENAGKNISKVVTGKADEKKVKLAELKYKRIKSDEYTDTLLIRLFTGRHHQIRLQLSANKTPILGDLKYGTQESVDFSKSRGISQLALKAVCLEFPHPTTHKMMKFVINGFEDGIMI